MPVQKCSRAGRPGYKWGQSGKCYVGPGAKAKASRQGAAVRASGWMENALAGRVDPLRADPTRTKMLRDQFCRDMRKRLAELKRRIVDLVVHENAFDLGSVRNARFAFKSSTEKLEAYNAWFKEQYGDLMTNDSDRYWERYIAEGYEKGAGRAFSDVYQQRRAESYGSAEKMAHYAGTKEEFLRSSFGAAESVEKIKLLASRTLTDLKGVGEAMAAKMSRTLVD